MIMSLFYGLATTQKKWWIYAVLGSALFIPLLLGEGKFGFFIAPLMVLFLFSRNLVHNSRTLLFLLLLLVVVYLATMWLMPIINPRSQLVEFLRSPGLIFQTYELPLQTTGIPVSRLGDIQFALNLVSRSPQSLLIGYGPGATSLSYFSSISGALYLKYSYLGWVFASSQLSKMLLEWGSLGFLLYVMSIVHVYRITNRLINRPDITGFWKGISWGFRGTIFVFVIMAVYWYIWQTDVTAYVFWGLAAITFKLQQKVDLRWLNVGR